MKKTNLFIIISTFVLLFSAGAVWYAYTRPIAITWDVGSEFPKPQYQPPAVPSGASTTIPPQASPTSPDESTDIRSWRERMRDSKIPLVFNIKWQTYVNKEYTFNLQYPDSWGVLESKNNLTKGIDIDFYQLSDPQEPLFGISIFKGQLMNELTRRGSRSWVERIQKYGLIPDAKINDISFYIDYPDLNSHETLLSAFFERNGNIYEFGESIFVAYDDMDKLIIEYMIKSFRFLK